MHQLPKVSVIIPMLNEQSGIQRAIHSVRDANEILVVDGGSRDNSVEIAQASGATVLESPQGRGVQLKTGASRATGDLLLMLHADCWLHAGAIQELRTASRGRTCVYGCFRQEVDSPQTIYRWLEWGNSLRATWLRTPYGDQAVFIDRKSYDQTGGVDGVALMEDVLLARKLRTLARPILLKGPVHLSARRWQRNGVLRQTLRNWTILAAFHLGVSPDTLARWYR